MWRFGLSLVLVMVSGFAGSWIPQKAASPGSCDVAAIPSQIREKLRNKFVGWRPKRLSDLDEDDQRIWLEGQTGKACPGIATGHFENANQTSYAFLLVPESKPTHGYRLVVLSNASNGELVASKLLDRADEETYSGLVVFTAKPGTFSDVEGTKKVRTKLDGIVVEWLEKGAVLYYWTVDRYRRLSISD